MRLIERPGVLHLFDGRRVVSFRGDDAGRRAIRRAVDGAGAALDAGPDVDGVRDAQELLIRLGLAQPDARPDGDVSDAAAFASAAVAGWVSAREAEQRLAGTDVQVWEGPGDELRRALSDSGARCAALPGPARIAGLDPARSLVVVAAADEEPMQRLHEVNAACLAHGVSWLPVGGYDGAIVHVGPLMIPGQSACAECLSRRLAANVEYAEAYPDICTAPSAPAPPALRDWAYSIAALIVLRWIANRDARLPGRLFTLVPDELTIREATVYRVPRCTSCAGPDLVNAVAPWDIARDH
ncbi:MAG: TOMM precursor leader peptide-binding protein [Jatrophihabitantaceae bacterium]